MTEMSPVATVSPSNKPVVGSVGKLIPHTKAKVEIILDNTLLIQYKIDSPVSFVQISSYLSIYLFNKEAKSLKRKC